MKKCPFCAEEIQEDAIKCKHCGEMIDKQKPVEVADIHKQRGKKIMLVGVLMMLGGIGGCFCTIASGSSGFLGVGTIIALIGFFVCVIGRFLE